MTSPRHQRRRQNTRAATGVRAARSSVTSCSSSSLTRLLSASLLLTTTMILLQSCFLVSALGNPASEHCEESGGTVELRTEPESEGGGQYGVCVLADGSECEEWSYMKGECGASDGAGEVQKGDGLIVNTGGVGGVGMVNPASKHCAEKGGKTEGRTKEEGAGEGGGTAKPYHVCVFEDGSECEEWAYFREECSPGGEGGGAQGEAEMLTGIDEGSERSGEDEGTKEGVGTRSSSSATAPCAIGAAFAAFAFML
mmetsp:Transcript_25782/g.48039  ORF Transcript_25782/g.48039 Transcript_25782/m.48039 type:complete len:254 (-) Transcript_25782:87-848(-)